MMKFLLPDQRLYIVNNTRMCAYIHTSDCVELYMNYRCYHCEWNIVTNGAVGIVEWIFIIEAPAWQ
jgi:hypothetical protein